MRVENPIDLLEIVYSMPPLRLLNVQILNDEHNIPDFESFSTEDEILQLLQEMNLILVICTFGFTKNEIGEFE